MADVFSQPKLVIGEGKVDKFFFSQLFVEHNLPEFEAKNPVVGTDTSGGIDKIGQYLKGLTAATTFSIVRKIVVAADNDDGAAFPRVCTELRKANYSVPSAAKQFVQTAGKPDLAILMIPDEFPGCLESLCFMAATNKWSALEAPFVAYFGATPATGWTVSKQAKMKVQCMLASTCKQNPQVALHDIWQKEPKYHIPVTDPVFQTIVAFLRTV